MFLSRSRIIRYLRLALLIIALSGQATNLLPYAVSDSASIQTQIESLQDELARLPKESLNLTPWTLGYRSRGYEQADVNISIEMHFESAFSVDLIALMPAVYTDDGEQLKPFCFPKRFTIERINQENEYELLVDCSDRDYLVEGIEPQLFRIDEIKAAIGLRLKILKLSENRTWVAGDHRAALAELMAFAGPNNVALNQEVSTSSNHRRQYSLSPIAAGHH